MQFCVGVRDVQDWDFVPVASLGQVSFVQGEGGKIGVFFERVLIINSISFTVCVFCLTG